MFGQQSTGLEQLLQRPKPSPLRQFLNEPSAFIAKALYRWRSPVQFKPITNPIVAVCISDTHNSQPQLPSGDILIHAGDLTQLGSPKEMRDTLAWLRDQPFEHKIVIGGNHDGLLAASRAATERDSLDWGDITYLENSTTTLEFSDGRTIRIFGSPYSPKNGNWPFQYPRSLDVWTDIVPSDLDILVTHAPPKAHLDLSFGCEHLLRALWRTRPKLHVFGHVHEGYGQDVLHFDALQGAYEDTITARGGVLNLIRVAYYFVCSRIWPMQASPSRVVNAAMVGGLRDELRRRPIKVSI